MKKYLLAVVFLCLSILSYSNDTEALDQDTNTGIITQAKDFAKVKGKSKKQIFIDTLIPTIEKIRTKIAEDKEYVKTLIEKEILTAEEKLYLEEMYTKYKVKSKSKTELVHKMVVPPTSFILGQASLESGWGSSKLAKEGNNLFAVRSSLRDPEKTVNLGPNQYYKRYESLEESLMDYVMTLSRHSSYSNLRKAINNGEQTIVLIKHLGNYSEMKNLYEQRLTQIITKNNLNNILLRKLRIALAFKSYDMIEVFKLGGVDISEAELNALFRSEDHRNYKECGDKYIRVFLKGLIEYCRD